MAVTIKLNSITPPDMPHDGWVVEYSIKGKGQFTPAPGSPFTSLPAQWTTNDPAGTLYDVRVVRDCGDLSSNPFQDDTPCDCSKAGDGVGYAPTPTGDQCYKQVTVAPNVTINACWASRLWGTYSYYGTRIYTKLWWQGTLQQRADAIFIGENGYDYVSNCGTATGSNCMPRAYLNFQDNGCSHEEAMAGSCKNYIEQWRNLTDGDHFYGPMNRSAIWLDQPPCDGSPDTFEDQDATAVLVVDNSNGTARYVYMGMGGDNSFLIKLNGTELVNTARSGRSTDDNFRDMCFKYWHIAPIFLPKQICRFEITTKNRPGGSGENPAAVALVLYDNIYGEGIDLPKTYNDLIHSCGDHTNDYDWSTSAPSGKLTILADTFSLVSRTPEQVITCPDGYTQGSVHGTVTCWKYVYDVCNKSSIVVPPTNLTVNWNYTNNVSPDNLQASFEISVNGQTPVSRSASGSGSLSVPVGATLVVQANLHNLAPQTGNAFVQVSGAGGDTKSGSTSQLISCTASSGTYNITATTSGTST